jgi:hypothetical protein
MEFKFNKKIINKFSLGQEPKDHEYWLTQSPEKRIAALEALRLQFYGEDKFKQGFQRVVNKASTNRKKDLGDLDNLP